MSNAEVAVNATRRTQFKSLLAHGMWIVVGLHAIALLVIRPVPVALSRFLTAAVPIMAGTACLWRAKRLPTGERPIWLWSSAGLFLWALAHIVETLLAPSSAASNLAFDTADFIYLAGTFPLLVALSTTRETELLRSVFTLNCAQIALALVLSYTLLYRMAMSPAAASVAMAKIYGAACILLAVMAALRVFAWATQEEKQSLRWICIVLWIYFPIELGMDYATVRWNLRAGSLFDLAWSIPFIIGGWQALHLPILPPEPEIRDLPSRPRLVVEALSPMLMTAGLFTLAASVTGQHPVLGLSAIFIVLGIQGVQSAVVQLNFLAGRNLLLQREDELRSVNASLQKMSLEDPLTGISNRRRFAMALEQSWRRGARKRQSIALVMIDVDFFKGVNDLHGHTYGDECLVAIAKIMRLHARRPDDIVARLGGEEFVLLLPDTDGAGAQTVAALVQAAIRSLGVINQASPFDKKLTVSIGIGTVSQPNAGVDPTVLVDCADQALYDAKHTGRNCTCTRALD
jgi:diguanylate cyclase (GGDEF)-like protein